MESSQLFGGTEECNSSESGWTMYIGSPTLSYSVGDDNHGDGGENDDAGNDNDDNDPDDDDNAGSHGDESDDSMVSDASSGPSHRERTCGRGGYGHGMNNFQYKKNEDDRTCKKADSRAEKQRAEQKRNGEKAESMFMARKANTHA